MDKKDVDVVGPKPQEVKPVVKVPSGPCATQIKDYQECLESFSSFFTGCKKQQESFKACPEFNTWVETSVKQSKNKI